jgi:hypothetical protein
MVSKFRVQVVVYECCRVREQPSTSAPAPIYEGKAGGAAAIWPKEKAGGAPAFRRKKREGHQRSGRGTREKPEGVNLVFPRLLSRTQKLEGNNTRFLVLLSEMEQAYLRKGTSEGPKLVKPLRVLRSYGIRSGWYGRFFLFFTGF